MAEYPTGENRHARRRPEQVGRESETNRCIRKWNRAQFRQQTKKQWERQNSRSPATDHGKSDRAQRKRYSPCRTACEKSIVQQTRTGSGCHPSHTAAEYSQWPKSARCQTGDPAADTARQSGIV